MEIYGGCCGCGVGTIGIYGLVAAAVWDLMRFMGVLWLRCWTYGADLWGARLLLRLGNPDCYRGCGLGPIGVKSMGL